MASMSETSPRERELAFNVLVEQADVDRQLSSQETRFVFLRVQGLSPRQAARGAGYPENYSLDKLEADSAVSRALQYFASQEQELIKVNRDKLTTMLFQAHASALNATEQINAIRELGKLHGQYESDRQRATKITLGNTTVHNHGDRVNLTVNRMERLSDAELLELSGLEVSGFLPDKIESEEEEVEEGNFVEVTEEPPTAAVPAVLLEEESDAQPK